MSSERSIATGTTEIMPCECPFVSRLVFGFEVDVFSGEPVEFVSRRIGIFLILVVPQTSAGGAYSHLFRSAGNIWHVDIDSDVAGKSVAESGGGEHIYGPEARGEIRVGGVVGQRETDRGYSECRSLHRRSHRAGIEHIDR